MTETPLPSTIYATHIKLVTETVVATNTVTETSIRSVPTTITITPTPTPVLIDEGEFLNRCHHSYIVLEIYNGHFKLSVIQKACTTFADREVGNVTVKYSPSYWVKSKSKEEEGEKAKNVSSTLVLLQSVADPGGCIGGTCTPLRALYYIVLYSCAPLLPS